jgi:plasmid stabilization system protein ParE
MKVFWTSEARLRLLEIHAYISQRSPRAASEVAARILRRSRPRELPAG